MAPMMSDAPLSKKEQEEEEMRQELKDVGLYYENMSVDEMRQIVNVLNESKNDSRKPNEDVVDDSVLFDETTSTQDTAKAAENVTKRPIPSFSYKQAVMSGTINQDPTDEIKNSNDKNLLASPSNSFEKNYTANSPDSESIYDRNSNFKKDEDYPTLSSRYKTRSATADTRTRTQETKKLPAAKKASMERWALDPLEFMKDKNTTPLRRPQDSESSSEENLPYCSEAIDLDSEEFDKLCQEMEEKLATLNKRCLKELDASQKMAAPIQINHEEAPVNKPPVKEKSFSINTPGPSNTPTRNTSERASKRKALSTIAAATELFENDENSDDEFSNTKKRKFQQAKKEEEAAKRAQENQKNKNVGKSIETISIDDSKDSMDMSFDNSDLHSIKKSSNKKVSNENKSDEAQSQYPRRVPPPNPGKKNYKGPRSKIKNNNNSTLIESKSDAEKKKIYLNDDDIQKTLQEIDEHIEDGDCVEITNDIKPSPIPKRIGKRLSLAANLLENAREVKEQKLKAEEEAKERREKEERLKKDALISSRLQEEENEKSRQLEKQKKCDEQTALYKNILGNKTRVTRSNFQQKKTPEEIAEDQLLEGDDDEPTITRVIEKHFCPICQKPFPADEIETHASGCDAYAMDSTEAYSRPSTSRFTEIHKCHICDRFETQDGNAYEEHVVNCRVNCRPRNYMNGGWISQ